MKKSDNTYQGLLNMLELCANAVLVRNQRIEGNPKLEAQRAQDVKDLEDMLFDDMAKDGVVYVRKYESLYGG